MSTGQELAQRDPAQQLVAQVRSPQFTEQVAMALPEGVTPERFVRVTTTALLANPDLARDCEHNSIFRALIECATTGLMPDGTEAAIVPYKDKKSGTKKAQLIAMIGGYRRIAAEYGWTLQTRVVYENDEYDVQLLPEEKIVHRPVRPGMPRGEKVAAYAIATHRDGRRMIEPMPEEDIAKVRAASRATYGPWVDWTERMWEKTVGRRLFKKLPLAESDKRVATILRAEDITPADATAALYGATEARALPASDVDAGTAGDVPDPDVSRDEPAETIQQAESAVDDTAPAVGSAPGDDKPAASPFEIPAAAQNPKLATQPQRDKLDELYRGLAGDDAKLQRDFVQACGGDEGEAWEAVRDRLERVKARELIDHLEKVAAGRLA